jgi:hypothetical protein
VYHSSTMKRFGSAVLLVLAPMLAACGLAGGVEPRSTPVFFRVPDQGLGLAADALPPPLTPIPDCAVTLPELALPPGESRAVHVGEENGHFVGLWPNGVVVFKPGGAGTVESDGALSMKFWWWRPERGGRLEINGHRLDAVAGPLEAYVPEGYDDYFTPTGLSFPTQGCWEVTGRVGDATITFVTLVLVQP